MRRALSLCSALALASLSSHALAQTCTVGSAVADRPIQDSASGLVLIYRGPSAPAFGPDTLVSWRFFDDDANGAFVTPLLFRVEGENLVLAAVGTSRASDASGAQSHPFAPIVGSDQLDPATPYTFGFSTRAVQPGPSGTVTTTSSYVGVVPFDGYNLTSEPWDYAIVAALSIGQVFGPSGVALNSSGSAGRIYSADFTLSLCSCPADCVPDGTLNVDDVQCFVTGFASQLPAADCVPDGAFNVDDVQCFIQGFLLGCP